MDRGYGDGPFFDLTILGCSGGPLDAFNCSYLLKPSGVKYDELIKRSHRNKFVCIDAGSGLAGITDWVLKNQSESTLKHNVLLDLYPDSADVSHYTHCSVVTPFNIEQISGKSAYQLALQIVEVLENYYITHAHVDHVAGVVVNSPGFKTKTINGSPETIQMLRNDIFNNRIWPKLDHLKFEAIQPSSGFVKASEDFTIKIFSNSHGCFFEEREKVQYESNAFLINYNQYNKSVLVFGDLEADSLSNKTCNAKVWEQCAPLIIRKSLQAVVIECSHSNLPSHIPLYGHMTPEYLIAEFLALKEMVLLADSNVRDPLKGLNVIISHVKETNSGSDPRKNILKELQKLNSANNLGINITMALPGLTYEL